MLLLATTTLGAAPAPAAEAVMSVQEVTHVRVGGPAQVTVYVIVHTDGKPGLLSFVQLAPRKGGGWNRSRFSVAMYNPGESRLAAYGGPVSQLVPCPAAEDVCGAEGHDGDLLWIVTFRPAAGNRYFFAGPTAKTTVYPFAWQWRARPSTLGARVVTGPEDATAAVGVTGGVARETFVSASAPGGKYGSGVFAMAPCDADEGESVGSASVKSDGSDAAVPISCKPHWYAAFSGTRDGRTWTMTGPVVGPNVFPFRLFVFDYPKR